MTKSDKELGNIEEALIESENNFRAILEAFPEGAFLIDVKGNILIANNALAKRFGMNTDEIKDFNIYDLLPPEVAKRRKDVVDKAIETKEPKYYVDKRDGLYIKSYVQLILDENKEISKVAVTAENITERKKAKEALKISEAYYLGLFDNIDEGLQVFEAIYDDNGVLCDLRFIDVNPAYERNTGIKPELVIGKTIKETYPDTEQKTFKAFSNVLKTGKSIYFEQFNEQLNRHYDIHTFRFAENKLAMLFRDISDSKKAEKALRESEERYSELFNSMNEMFQVLELVYDDNGQAVDFIFRDFNPATERLLNMDRDQIIGKRAKELFGTVEDYWIEALDQVNKTKEPMHITNYSAELDKYYDVNEFKLKGQNKVAIVFTDITEQKKAEEKLKHVNERLNIASKAAYVGIWDWDIKTDSIEWNTIMFEIFGLNPDKDTASFESWNKVLHPEDVEIANKRIDKAIKEHIFLNSEYRIVKPDGQISWINALGEAEYDKDGNPIWMTGICIDITDRKKAEKALKQTRDNLEEQVEKRTVELKEAIEELERSNEELQQFAYVSSHDLQEPLRTIASFTQLLERRYKGKFDSDADEFMDFIVEAAIRMKEQIEGLLKYSRVGTKGKEFVPVDTNEVLKQTIGRLDTYIDESGAEITYDELPVITSDAEQLQRVFQNLISNAIKFRKCEEQLKIQISATKSDDEYIFSVQDNGIGIEEQYMERIFVIFQRLHTRDVYHGTGIGLSIVKRVIERHGGHVWVESEFGVGSTFYFTIPIE